ncbi:MAG: hypothetical protein IJQ31_06930 [Thermoguttaceae bacterium]|nr:hypothetical protein [Thermoguttaceae bacterium]
MVSNLFGAKIHINILFWNIIVLHPGQISTKKSGKIQNILEISGFKWKAPIFEGGGPKGRGELDGAFT